MTTDATAVRWLPSTLSDPERARAQAALSPPETDRLAITPEAQRDSFLAGRLLLRDLVTELTGRTEVVIEALCPHCGGPHGRPTVDGVYLSLSRCAGAVVAAASLEAPLGVDAELKGTDPNWTRIEAVLKADGRGLGVDPSEVTVKKGIGSIGGSGIRYRVRDVNLHPDLQVSVAVREDAAGLFRRARNRIGRRGA